MANNSDEKLFNIQMASTASGISAHTIRAWEKRYRALNPMRTEAGKRMYSEGEVERLKTLALLVNLGSSISQIAGLKDAELVDILNKLNQTKERYSMPVAQGRKLPPDEIRRELLAAVANYDVQVLTRLLQDARTSLNQEQLVFEIFVPLLDEVKLRMQKGEIQKAQLHALESLIRFNAASSIEATHEIKGLSRHKFFIPRPSDCDPTLPVLTALLCSHHRLAFFFSHISLPMDCIVDTALAVEAQIIILHRELKPQEESLIPSNLQLWQNTSKQSGSKTFKTLQELNELLRKSA